MIRMVRLESIWRYLPHARSRLLAVAVALLAAFYAAVAIGFALNIGRQPSGLLLGPLFALLAWGIWSLSRFARWVTLIWLWIFILVMPIGVFAPPAGDGEGGTPYWGALLAGVTPLIVMGLFFIYVLGKHKREFKWP
jgi:hypothetical protein